MGPISLLNESLECGLLIMCQLFDSKLNKYIMKITTEFCREQAHLSQPRNEYVKTAAVCLGKQLWLNDLGTQ